MNSAELKLQLLVHGMQIHFESITLIDNYKKDKYWHNDRHFTLKKNKKFVPQEIILKHDSGDLLCCSVLIRKNSPFLLKVIDGKVKLLYNNVRLDNEIELVKEPEFWKEKTSDGTPIYSILSNPGLNEYNLWPWHDCYLHEINSNCKYCTATTTANDFGFGVKSELLTSNTFISDDIQQILNSKDFELLVTRSIESVNCSIKYNSHSDYWFTIISGAMNLERNSIYYEIISNLLFKILSNTSKIAKQKIVCNLFPNDNSKDLMKIKKAGANYYMANLELWSDSYLKMICPGKHQFGRNKILDSLKNAIDIFSNGNVWCNFVCGLEPFDSQLSGYEELSKMGVVCGANIFHKDPNVHVDFINNFSTELIKDYYLEAAQILKSNNLKPFYSLESRRSSLLWEAYLGLL